MSRRRRTGGVTAAALLLLLAAGHLYFWYWPRLRAAVPRHDSLAARQVVVGSHWDFGLWIPYPHQNLGLFRGRLRQVDRTLASLQDLLGQQPLDLPSFGPFAVPPASELALATDREGRDFVAVAKIYPAARWLLRTAGRLAGNPWLAGGELVSGGRRVQIGWRGPYWWASSQELAGEPDTGVVTPGASTALVRLGRELGGLPAGLYRVRAEGSDWLVTSVPFAADAARSLELPVSVPDSVAALWARVEPSAAGTAVRALALLPAPRRAEDGNLPPLLVLHAGPGEPWRLPGESWMRRVAGAVVVEERSGWRLAAFGAETLQAGSALLPLLGLVRDEAERTRLAALGELDLEQARLGARAVARLLQPLAALEVVEARRWLALADLLDAFGDFERLGIRVGAAGAVELRLQRRPVN